MTDALDAWIATMFDEDNAQATWEALTMAQVPDDAAIARREAAERTIAECDRKLAKYRQALEADGDALVIAGWMREVQGERLAAERVLGDAAPDAEELTVESVRALIRGIRDAVAMLQTADPKIKAQVYEELGVAVTYEPGRRTVKVRTRPCSQDRVGGGTRTLTPPTAADGSFPRCVTRASRGAVLRNL